MESFTARRWLSRFLVRMRSFDHNTTSGLKSGVILFEFSAPFSYKRESLRVRDTIFGDL